MGFYNFGSTIGGDGILPRLCNNTFQRSYKKHRILKSNVQCSYSPKNLHKMYFFSMECNVICCNIIIYISSVYAMTLKVIYYETFYWDIENRSDWKFVIIKINNLLNRKTVIFHFAFPIKVFVHTSKKNEFSELNKTNRRSIFIVYFSFDSVNLIFSQNILKSGF